MKGNSSKPTPTGRGVILFLVLLLCLNSPVLAWDLPAGSRTAVEDEGSLIEKLVSLPVEGLYRSLTLLGFKNFDELIFNNSYGDKAPFTGDEWETVMTWYAGIRDSVWALLVIAVAVAGYRYKKSSVSPDKRVSLINCIESVVYAFAIVTFMPYAVQLVFQANNALVALFKGIAGSLGTVSGVFDLDDIKTGSVLGTAAVKLGYTGLLAYFNFLYLIRKFVLTSMLIITPIVAWAWTISGRKEGIGIVLGEIASNAFMQAAHALVLALYLSLLAAGISSDFSPWWAQIFGMVCLIPTANVIRNLLQGWLQKLGVNEEGWAGAAALGLTGLAGLASIAETTLSPKTSLKSFLGGGNSGGGPAGGGPAGGSSLVNPVSSGMSIGGVAGSFGGAAGKILGAAMSLPLKTAGVDLSGAISGIGGFAGGVLGRQAGTAYSIIKAGREESSNNGFGLIQGIGKVVGVDGIKSGPDIAEAAGRFTGAVVGSAAGIKGAEIGGKIGGSLGRYGLQTAGLILAVNPDRFRWN